jgi:acyl-CoA synthetase (AMP-forming)/AMP-acid ligase II
MNVLNVLEKCAQEYKNKTAVIFRQEEISFFQLRDKVFSFAQSLLKL